MLSHYYPLLAAVCTLLACNSGTGAPPTDPMIPADSTGVRMIPISTPKGDFEVYTRQLGQSDDLKVLLLHGGPGLTYETWEPLGERLPREGVEVYYYDQLGSFHSSQPSDTSLWNIPRFVDEVDQVRRALGMDSTNFVLMGQSWGGILAMEYALAHPEALKGLVVSNMMSSAPAYNDYVANVLAPKLPPAVRDSLAAIEDAEDYGNPRYMGLLMEYYYPRHVLNMPLAEWPASVTTAFEHLNPEVYVHMQGPSEFGIKGGATLETWDITARLQEIKTPTLVIAGEEDTMDPAYLEMMSERLPNGSYLLNPGGGHLVQYDSQATYFPGLLSWLKGL